ncbi:MAG TPA: alpha/beta hydrolase [Deinococcales bacterium]|nr:alpha/beta hydrolase [Deinococcales bacterium]
MSDPDDSTSSPALDEWGEALGRDEQHLEHLNGVDLYFEDTGPLDAPALLYLHGGPGYNSYSFRDLTGEYLSRYRVVYLDGRGGGRSGDIEPDPALTTIDALVGDVEAVRNFLGIERFTPVGHGFGAIVALDYARRYGRHVERVVAVNPWVHFPELSRTLLMEAARASGKPLEEIPEDSEERVEQAFAMLNARDLLTMLHFPTPQGRMRLEFSDTESGLLAGGTIQEGLVANGLWDFEYPLYFSEIHRPISVIAGTWDPTSYPGQTDWLVDLAGADLVELEGLGHYPWVDDAEMFAEALMSVVPPKPAD